MDKKGGDPKHTECPEPEYIKSYFDSSEKLLAVKLFQGKDNIFGVVSKREDAPHIIGSSKGGFGMYVQYEGLTASVEVTVSKAHMARNRFSAVTGLPHFCRTA